ncbi:MAG TPA: amino acid ABC transporter permease [Gammaproteobacteria bacterium]|nr:amino acid ABC transporter permease [Gammaproteobacteria bacterium]
MDWIFSFYNYRVVAEYLPIFANGMWATVWISTVSLVLSLIIGTLVTLAHMSHRGWLNRSASAYIEAIRATPLLVQIYVIYFGLPVVPLLDWRIGALQGGIIALALNSGAYMAEIIRAGIEAVPSSQTESAMAVGMSYRQRMVQVILPQAFANVLPPVLGQAIVLIKDSSLLSIITVSELLSAGLTILSERVMPNEGFLTVAVGYLAIYLVMLVLSVYTQRRLGGIR